LPKIPILAVLFSSPADRLHQSALVSIYAVTIIVIVAEKLISNQLVFFLSFVMLFNETSREGPSAARFLRAPKQNGIRLYFWKEADAHHLAHSRIIGDDRMLPPFFYLLLPSLFLN
jgi:hypothetical protein